jgi:hypothetical protein
MAAGGQQPLPDLFAPQAAIKKHENRKQKPDEHGGPHPSAEISLQQLGFAAPASFYLGDRLVQASLDFLDEDRLLFTFRVPGLVVRDSSGGDAASAPGMEERNIRAVVLSLPSGRIEAESLWHLHDFAAYLWMLRDGHFLLRDRNILQIGDGDLNLDTFLRFPGKVKYIELDPQRQMLVAQSSERLPPGESHKSGSESGSDSSSSIVGNIASNDNSAATGSVLPAPGDSAHRQDTESANYLRIFRFDSRKLLLTTRISDGIMHLPIDGDGYYDAVRGRGSSWMITYHGFSGPDVDLFPVDSACTPPLDVVAPGVVLVSACNDSGGRHLVVVTRGKRRLWEMQVASTHVWPLLAHSESGRRVARATLDVMHPISAGSPLDPSDIHSETIQVFDVATGKIAITGPASPILDGGGNFALSPSGNRFAVLNDGSIQVYDLPPAPPVPPTHPDPR